MAQVQAAIKRLDDAQFIRKTEEGWKLQTAPEKNWDTERQATWTRSPVNATRSPATSCGRSSANPRFKTYRHKELRNFRIGVTLEGTHICEEGDLPLTLCIADEPDDLPKQARRGAGGKPPEAPRERPLLGVRPDHRHRRAGRRDFTPPARWSRSTTRCEHKTRSTPTRRSCLQDEKTPSSTTRTGCVTSSRRRWNGAPACSGASRGMPRRWARRLSEILKKLYGHVVPDLYPKLEMGSRPLKGDEAEDILKAADLKALPPCSTAASKGWGWSSRTGRSTSPTPLPTSPRKSRLPRGRARLRQQGVPHGQGAGEEVRRDRLRLGPGHAAADPGRALPGRVDRGYLPRQPLPQLSRPAWHAPPSRTIRPFATRSSLPVRPSASRRSRRRSSNSRRSPVRKLMSRKVPSPRRSRRLPPRSCEKLHPLKATR